MSALIRKWLDSCTDDTVEMSAAAIERALRETGRSD